MAKSRSEMEQRQGITLLQLTEMFPDEGAAREWFESVVWPSGRHCPRCGSERTHEASHARCPYRCTDCRSYFSVKTGTALERSKISLRKWAIAIYLEMTSLKGVSSLKLHRDIGVSQKTAWFMLHRLREAFAEETGELMSGPAEADETYMGGRRKNMHAAQRRVLTGRGAVGKTAVAGVKDRETKRVSASVVERTDRHTLTQFIKGRVESGVAIFTDESLAYDWLGATSPTRASVTPPESMSGSRPT